MQSCFQYLVVEHLPSFLWHASPSRIHRFFFFFFVWLRTSEQVASRILFYLDRPVHHHRLWMWLLREFDTILLLQHLCLQFFWDNLFLSLETSLLLLMNSHAVFRRGSERWLAVSVSFRRGWRTCSITQRPPARSAAPAHTRPLTRNYLVMFARYIYMFTNVYFLLFTPLFSTTTNKTR